MEDQLLISICCQTYNHEKFIALCLDGFVMQKTNFRFEILVHEDASTDNTALIIKEYESKYPDMFRCVYQTTNQFAIQNTLTNILLPMSKGKYIALCEGDDYWTDPYKLQKQVDFLEANPDMTLCAHNASISENNTIRKGDFVVEQFTVVTKKELISHNPIMTASVVFRSNIIDIPKWLGETPYGDYALYFLAIMKGGIGILPDDMCVYRKHHGGVHSVLHNKRGGMIKVWMDHIKFYQIIKNTLLGFDHEDIIELNKTLYKCYSNLLCEYKEQDKIIHYYLLKLKLYISRKLNKELSNW
jgi:glycosyltransferase involved in cell wall biosynthesis